MGGQITHTTPVWLGLLKSCIYVCLINYLIYIIILQMIEEYIQNMRMYK